MEFDIKSNSAAECLKGIKKQGKAKTTETESKRLKREEKKDTKGYGGRRKKKKKISDTWNQNNCVVRKIRIVE